MTEKRMQVVLSDEAWKVLESTASECSAGFTAGSISYSDIMNEMVLTSRVDIKALQLKHTDYRRIIKNAMKEKMEFDTMFEMLQELRAQTGGKKIAKKPSSKEIGTDA